MLTLFNPVLTVTVWSFSEFSDDLTYFDNESDGFFLNVLLVSSNQMVALESFWFFAC